MKISKGDKIIGMESHNKGLIREILEVRKTGYTWKYNDTQNEHYSENSNDPYFDFGWKLIN